MFRVIALASLIALAGCHRQADAPGDAPSGLAVDPGDGQVTVRWNQQSGLTYWIFFQAGSTVTAAATGVPLIFDAQSPRIVAGLANGTQYAFIMNATNQDSKAGPSTPVVLGVPRPAGAIWTPGPPIVGSVLRNLNRVAFGTVPISSISTARLVAVGDSGSIFSGDYNYTNASPPGVTAWTPASVPLGFASDLSAALYTGSFVALGTNGSVLTSADGNTWTSTASIPSTGMNGITLGNSPAGLVFVAVGAGGKIFTSPPDLSAWTLAAFNAGADLFNVFYTSFTGSFVATGANGTLLTSPDAITWTRQSTTPPTTSALRGTAFGTGSAGALYVVVGDAGTILTSINGTTWNPVTPPPLSDDLRSVAIGSRFVAVGRTGAAIFSDDGTHWQLPSVGPGAADLSAVVSTPAMYVTVGALGANAVSK